MSYEYRNELTHLLDSFSSAAETLGEIVGVDSLAEVARFEVAQYLMYLSCSDGRIRENEVRVINDTLNMSLDADMVKNLVDEHNIYSTEFESTPPVVFKKLVEIDNELHARGLVEDAYISEQMYAVYEVAGKILSGSDGDCGSAELGDQAIYLAMLKNYLDENLVRSFGSVTEETGRLEGASGSQDAEGSFTRSAEGALLSERVVALLEEILSEMREANATLDRIEDEISEIKGVGLEGDSLADVCQKLDDLQGIGPWNSLSDIYSKLDDLQGTGVWNSLSDICDKLDSLG